MAPAADARVPRDPGTPGTPGTLGTSGTLGTDRQGLTGSKIKGADRLVTKIK